MITEHRVPELIPVLGSQRTGTKFDAFVQICTFIPLTALTKVYDVSHKPGGRLPLLSARPAVTPATFHRAITNFAAW